MYGKHKIHNANLYILYMVSGAPPILEARCGCRAVTALPREV